MPLSCCSLAGVDEATPLVELAAVSDMYPYAEWGFVYSPKQQGGPGPFPSVARIGRALKELPPYVRLALHLRPAGGVGLLNGEPVVCGLVEQVRERGGRVQMSFDAAKDKVDPDLLRQLLLDRPELVFITLHGRNNQALNQALADLPNHALLFDSPAGGAARIWPAAPSSTTCGYAGGLGPENLGQLLPRIYDAAGRAEFWIQLDGRLRDEHDRFSMPLARQCLELVSAKAAERMDLPAPRPLRRRCEPLNLIDSGLIRNDDTAREFEMMLRLLIRATRDIAEPGVLEVRRMAESLLLRKGTISSQREGARTYRPASLPGVT